MLLMMEFDVNVGDDDLSSGLSPILNGFTGCVEKAQAFDFGELSSSLSSASRVNFTKLIPLL